MRNIYKIPDEVPFKNVKIRNSKGSWEAVTNWRTLSSLAAKQNKDITGGLNPGLVQSIVLMLIS